LEDFDIQAVIDHAVSTIRPMAEKNNNLLNVQAAEDLGKMYADLLKVRQIVINLLSNASKFTENGEITLEAVRESLNGKAVIRFSVTDNGIGMTSEQQAKVFSAFTQADGSTTRRYGGTGLGLTISRRLAQLMGGDIYVTSEINVGSTFTVILPARVSDGDVKDAPLILTGDQGKRKTGQFARPDLSALSKSAPEESSVEILTLVIGHDKTLINDIQTVAGSAVSVMGADDRAEGLRLARVLQPAAILLDADHDGLTLLSEMKADRRLVDVPVVLYTLPNDDAGYIPSLSNIINKPVQEDHLRIVAEQYAAHAQDGKVLVIDDDAGTRELVREMLTDQWTVTEAGHPQIALASLSINTPNLILLNLNMQNADSLSFLEDVRQAPEWRFIPVIGLLNADLNEDERHAFIERLKEMREKRSYTRKDIINQLLVRIGRPITS
ncbi:MAG: response regulator, partial [Chloroflexi bacterium]|nr:response regulator [Chloroflexota bacterium]